MSDPPQHTSKHIDFIKSEVIPYLISNIIENIEDYLARKKEEMHGQKVGRGGAHGRWSSSTTSSTRS